MHTVKMVSPLLLTYKNSLATLHGEWRDMILAVQQLYGYFLINVFLPSTI